MIYTSNIKPVLLLSFNNVEVLIGLCLIFIFFAAVFLAMVFISRSRKKRRNLKINIIQEQCQNYIAELVFEVQLSLEGNKNKKYLFKNAFRRSILLQELIKLHGNLQGDLALKLEDYYIESGIFKDSLKKLKSGKKNTILVGLSESVEMNAKTCIKTIHKLLDASRDKELSNYLITAIVKLDVDYGMQLLLNIKYFVSDWLQLKVIKILDDLNYTQIPPLNEWLAKGGSLAIFGCRLTAFTKSREDVPTLVELLKSDNEDLKIEALKTLSILEAEEVNMALISMYLGEDLKVKEEILKTLSGFKKTNNLPFFMKCTKSENKETKLIALQAIDLIMQSKSHQEEKSGVNDLIHLLGYWMKQVG